MTRIGTIPTLAGAVAARAMIPAPAMNSARAKVAAMAAAAALALTLAAPSPALAQEASGQPYLSPGSDKSLLIDSAEKERYKALAHELRCLVCQNQTLADSDASLAVDLRRQVESMILDGRSNDEIKKYLVERYGDFVLYKPPMQSNTWLLWVGPFALLAIGIAIWFAMQRRRRTPAAGSGTGTSTGTGTGTLPGDRGDRPAQVARTDTDLERARRLLDGD